MWLSKESLCRLVVGVDNYGSYRPYQTKKFSFYLKVMCMYFGDTFNKSLLNKYMYNKIYIWSNNITMHYKILPLLSCCSLPSLLALLPIRYVDSCYHIAYCHCSVILSLACHCSDKLSRADICHHYLALTVIYKSD